MLFIFFIPHDCCWQSKLLRKYKKDTCDAIKQYESFVGLVLLALHTLDSRYLDNLVKL